MSIKMIIIGFCLSITSIVLYGQSKRQNEIEFANFAYEAIDLSEFKDSAAIYTCKLQFIVKRGIPSEVNMLTNDSTVTKYIGGLEKLKKFDFSRLMKGRKTVVFQVPIAIIIIPSTYGKHEVDLNRMSEKISMLYYDKTALDEDIAVVQFFPLIITVDKKVYD